MKSLHRTRELNMSLDNPFSVLFVNPMYNYVPPLNVTKTIKLVLPMDTHPLNLIKDSP